MPRKTKLHKMIKLDKKVRLGFGSKSFINDQEASFKDALREITQEKNSLSFTSADELIQQFEEMGERILIEEGYPKDCSNIKSEDLTEIAFYANRMLSHLNNAKKWIAITDYNAVLLESLIRENSDTPVKCEHIKEIVLNMRAAVREGINAICQFVYLKNSDIADNYLSGQKKTEMLDAARQKSVVRAKERTNFTHNKIRRKADEAIKNGEKRSEVIKQLAVTNNMTPKHIRSILKNNQK